MEQFTVILLAAGQGTRMKSPLPKVLHPVAGQPMILRIIETLQALNPAEVRVVVGGQDQLVTSFVKSLSGVSVHIQPRPLGTGDAVRAGVGAGVEGPVIIMNGDHPLVSAEDVTVALHAFRSNEADVAVISCQKKNPGDMGRIVRQRDEVFTIVEASELSHVSQKIREVNTGMYVVNGQILPQLIEQIDNNNSKSEYYLTHIVSLAREQGYKVVALPGAKRLSFGVNNQEQLALATKYIYRKKAKALMAEGVVIIDPQQTYIEEKVSVGQGSVIYPGVHIKGSSTLGRCCVVEPCCFLNEVKIEDSVQIRAFSSLEKAQVGAKALIGPYARIRPDTVIGEEAHIGNFVELKKVKFGKRSKANHLTYLGDAQIGEDSNIGCGTITCNYAIDRKKYPTIVGSGVFVGSDVQFVAPVTVGDHAIIGAGSTITKDVPERALGIARAKQANREGFVREPDKSEETEMG